MKIKLINDLLSYSLFYRGEYAFLNQNIPDKYKALWDRLDADMQRKIIKYWAYKHIGKTNSIQFQINIVAYNSVYFGRLNTDHFGFKVAILELQLSNEESNINFLYPDMHFKILEDVSRQGHIVSLDFPTDIGKIFKNLIGANKNNIMNNIRNKATPISEFQPYVCVYEFKFSLKDLIFYFRIELSPKERHEKQIINGNYLLKTGVFNIELCNISVNVDKMREMIIQEEEL